MSFPSSPSIAALTAAVLVSIPAMVGAQASSAYGYVYDRLDNSYPCLTPVATQTGAADIDCGTSWVRQGYGLAVASANNAARTASSYVRIKQIGPHNTLAAEALAYAYAQSSVTLIGPAAQVSRLAFHFQMAASLDLFGAGGYTNFSRTLATLSGSGNAGHQEYTYGDGDGYVSSHNSTLVPGGIDFYLAPSGSSVVSYLFQSLVETVIFSGEHSGTDMRATLDMHLLGIDAEDWEGNTVGSAVFNEDGTSSITFEGEPVPTPEPATALLLGAGLAGIGMCRRMRQL